MFFLSVTQSEISVRSYLINMIEMDKGRKQIHFKLLNWRPAEVH